MTAQWPLQRSPRCWCGRRVSWDGVFCAEHDDGPAPAPLAAAMKRHPAGKALPQTPGDAA